MPQAIEVLTRVAGERPLGWYTGRTSPNTRRLVAEEGGFLYDADDYTDDLPYWAPVGGKPQLIVPYTLDANDMRFAAPQGFNSGDQFFAYLKDSFDVLYAEGAETPEDDVGRPALPAGRPARPSSPRWSGSSTTPRATRACGSAAASTSPGTGASATPTGRTAQNDP